MVPFQLWKTGEIAVGRYPLTTVFDRLFTVRVNQNVDITEDQCADQEVRNPDLHFMGAFEVLGKVDFGLLINSYI